ncbi:hypothetical protein DUNSADRAFT_1939 [Dunaliella salina]|uniref:Vacuolar sorting protein 39/Transforming growth factor beta receptor-associated domain-containing protein n=1 Tax=Dunaliella salina TaxID=3046 RepID=A0ABQ7GWD1_DUNSA|nr:hypothetical protein DUNSADRAFT_1939 [Dunaliella salina]|eukprot:KAF5838923.1 hypothetical protein DUNSADRAFT_1939 [Dunaliella salina]
MVAVNVGSVGSALAPAIAVCPSGEEVLLACDNAAAFLSPSGTPSRRSSLTFKEPLLELVATDYYVVGFLASGAEVHSLRRTGDAYVSQFMPEIQGARIVSSPGMSPVDGSIFVGMSGDQGIRRLVPLPLETQAELLAAAGEYQEALALAALASARASQAAQRYGQLQQQQGQQPQQQEEFQGRALLASPQGNWHPMAAGEDADSMSAEGGGGSDSVLEDRLRLLYGNHLFASGAWDEGAAQLTLCSGRVTGLTGAPLLLLRLLPSLVPEAWRSALPDHAAGTPLLTVTEPEGPSFATASATLLPYLMSYRTRIISALQSCHDNSRDACSNGVGDGKLQNGSPAVAEACIRVLSIIDVAVVAILLAQPEDTGALLRFVQQPKHWIDLEEGEKLLSSHGYYAELAALYKHYSKHEQGLELLRRTSQQPDSLQPHARGAAADLPGLPGVWATVRYMVTLGGMDRREVVPLIRRHAKWVLEADPDAGLQAFLEMQPPLDPSTVLSILHQHSPHYCSMYLEAALQLGVALPQDYHSELLLIYLQEILSKDEDALQTLKGPKDSDEEEEQGRDRGMASLGKGKDHPRESSPKATKSWAHSKSAIARTHTELLFPLDPEQKRATPAISIVPRRTLSRVAQEDAESRPRSLGTLERTKGSQASLSQTLLSDEEQESRSPSLLLPGLATDGDYGAEGNDRQRHARTPSDPIPNFEVELAPDSHHSRFLAQHQAQQQELQQQTPTQHPSREDELQQQGDVFGDQQHPGLPAQSFRQQQGEQMAPACTKRSRRRRGVRRLGSGYGLGSLSFTENGAPPSLYERLRHLVYTSPYIDPDYVLTKLPPGQLPEIRALMLERLRRHREALSLYVHDLRSLSAAEAYCDRVYAAEQALLPPHLQARHQLNPSLTASPTTAPKELPAGPALGPTAPHTLLLRKPSDIYLMLVQVVLAGHQFPSQQMPTPLSPMPSQSLHEEQRQQHGEQQQHQQQQGKREHSLAAGSGAAGGLLALDERTWSQLTWLLSRKCGRMDPLEVLEILPEDVPLCDLMPWLGAALGHCTEQTRNMAVVKQLRRSESLNLREAVGRAKQGHVLLSSERICCLCYKRIGPAVFVAHPDRTLAHYVCHTRKERSKK